MANNVPQLNKRGKAQQTAAALYLLTQALGGTPVQVRSSAIRFYGSVLILLSLVSASQPLLKAQATPVSNTYDPRLTFAPLTLPDPVNAYRSSNGAPGPSFWENEASYEMHATLHTADKQRRDNHLHQQQPGRVA